MKRILTILLAVMMLFSFTGCDPDGRAKLAGYMGKMGQNVLGSDTSAATNVGQNAKVDTSEIKKAEDITKEVEGEPDKVAVEVVQGLDVKLSKEEAAKVESVLPPMKKEQKDKVLDDIGSALQNTESTKVMIEDMKKPYSENEEEKKAVEKAAQGTAVVMKSALKQVSEQLPSEVPDEIKASIGDLGKSLDKIAENPEGITKADVVTLQLVQSFVETVNTKKDEIMLGSVPDEVLSDANNLLTVASALSEASKFDPLSIDFSALVPDSSIPKMLARNSAPTAEMPDKEDVKDKVETLADFIVEPDVQKYVNLVYDIVNDIIGNGSFSATKSGLAFHKMSYENYANMAATNLKLEIKYTESSEAHPQSEVEVTYNGGSPYMKSVEFKEFRTFSGLMQYAAAAFLSEGDDYYNALKAMVNEVWPEKQDAWADAHVNGLEFKDEAGNELAGEALTEAKKAAKNAYIDGITAALKALPGDIKTLIDQFSALNSWVKAPSKENVNLVIPTQYEALKDFPVKELGDMAMVLMTGRDEKGEFVKDQHQYFRATFETLNKMVVFTDLSSIGSLIGDMDLNLQLSDVIYSMYVEPVDIQGK